MAYNLYPEADALLLPAPRRQPRPVASEFDLFGAIGSGVASGFGVVANVLDTPFASGRDLLSGKNPFPGLIDPERRTTTREFFGIEDDPDSWLDEIADITASVVFDPVTYATGGAAALSKSGKVLRMVGLLDDVAKVASKKAGQSVGKRLARITTTPADVLMSLDEPLRAKAMDSARDAAGKLGWNFDELLAREGDKPVGGLIGAGVPLVGDRLTFGAFGTGKRSQQAAAAMDLLGEKIRWSAPGRAVAKVFDKSAGNFMDERSQRAAGELMPIHEAARQDARQTGFHLIDQYDKILSRGYVKEDDLEKILARAVEYKQGTPVSQITADIAKKFGKLPDPDQQALGEMVGYMRQEVDSIKGLHDSIGLNLSELYDPFVEYAPRYLSDFFATRRRQQKLFNTFFESSQARSDILRAIPEGRSALDAMMKDARITGKNKLSIKDAAAMIAGDYGVTDAAQAQKLAKFFARMPDEALGQNLFGSPVRDVLRYVESGVETHATGDYTQQYLARFAKPLEGVSSDAIPLGSGASDLPGSSISAAVNKVDPAEALVPLENVLKASGFTEGGKWVDMPDGLPQSFTPTPAATPGQALLEGPGGAVGQIGQPIPPQGTKRVYVEGNKHAVHPAAIARMADLLQIAPEDVLKMGVPADVANFVTRTMQPFTSTPAGMKPWLDASDWFLNSFKGLATGPFIAFHGRNFGSGQARNWQLGALDPRDVKAIDGLLRSGKPLAGIQNAPAIKRLLAERGLPATPENGTHVFKELAYIYEVSGGHVSQPADVLGGALDEFAKQVPGRIPFSFKATARAAHPFGKGRDAWNPMQVRGGYDLTKGEEVIKSKFAPAVAGEALGEYVENLNRLAPFATLLKRGEAAGVAAAKVTAAHGSYASRNFTQAENEIFRRLFPFFKFSANQTRWLAGELMERPGGRLAKTIRAVAATQQQDPFAPDYIKRGASIPLSPGPSGEPRYLAGLGIMEEDPLSFAGGGGGMEILSRLNPLIKGPAEAILNQSFFQTGRPLSSLDMPIGRTIANLTGRDKPVDWLGGATRPVEQLLSNVIPRPGTTLRTLTDKRKELGVRLLNTTTGLRVVDVPEAARDQVVRQIAQDLLEQYPDTKRKVTTYIPKEDLEAMPAAQREEAQRLIDLLQMLDRRGKARSDAKKSGG